MGTKDNALVNVIDFDKFPKSNLLINAKYGAPIMAQRILVIALSQIPYAKRDKDGFLVCEIPSTILKKVMGKEDGSGSWYKQIKLAAAYIQNLSVGFSDDEHKKFIMMSVTDVCVFDNGILKVYFSPKAEPYLLRVQNKFTYLRLSTLMKFKSDYSFRLYEICKSKAYFANMKKNTQNVYEFVIGLSELKFEIGVLNINMPEVIAVVNNTNIDYDKAASIIKNQKYTVWHDMRAEVIKPAVKEINRLSDINVIFEAVRGKENKIAGVRFTVSLKEDQADTAIFRKDSENPESRKTTIAEINEVFNAAMAAELPLSPNDIETLIKAAGGDKNLVLNKIQVYDSAAITQEKEIKNPMGWLLACIKNDYHTVVVTNSGTAYAKDVYINPETKEELDISTLPAAIQEYVRKNYKRQYPRAK